MADIQTNQTRQYGDLIVTMTSDYTWRWDDRGSGADRDGGFWHAKAQGNLKPLGSIGFSSYSSPVRKRATLLVGPKSGSSKPAVAAPKDYTLIWKDEKSGGKYDGSFWRPVAPSGYVAVGDVVMGSWGKPSTSDIWCVRADLVSEGRYRDWGVWDDRGSGAKADCSIWDIHPISIGTYGTDKIPLTADCFRANNSYSKPETSIARVPLLEIKKDFTQFNTPLPDLDPHKLPSRGDTFGKLEQCRVVLPFIVHFEADDQQCVDNVANPFCISSRSIAWTVSEIYNNDSSGSIRRTDSVTTGLSKEKSESFSHSAGVSVSSSFGVLGASFDVSLNYQFSYQQNSSYTEYEVHTREVEFTGRPYSATVVFAKHIWLKSTRSDESWVLGEVEFNANEELHLKGVSLKDD